MRKRVFHMGLMGLGFLLLFPGSSAHSKSAFFCLQCHSEARMEAGPFWERVEGQSVYQTKMDPCPAIRSAAQEIFFTEKRFYQLHPRIERIEKEGWGGIPLRQGAAEASFAFDPRGSRGMASVSALEREAFSIRSSIQKIYERTVALTEETSFRELIGFGGIGFLSLLFFLWVALRKLAGWAAPKGLILWLGAGLAAGLTSCASPVPEPPKKTLAQERVERIAEIATRHLGRMEDLFYQSALLASVAREWASVDGPGAEKAFQLAWDMALAARKSEEELRTLREVSENWKDEESARKDGVNWETILDLRDELRRMDARTWGPRAVAEQWMEVNAKQGKAALEKATQEAFAISDAGIRDEALFAIAGAWAGKDVPRCLEVARSIQDPYLKAMAMILGMGRENRPGRAPSGKDLLEEAWKIATEIPDPYARIKAQAKISSAAAKDFPDQKGLWADRIFGEIQKIPNPLLQSMATHTVVREWASIDPMVAERWAAGISLSQPAVRAYALLELGRVQRLSAEKSTALLKGVIAEANRVEEPFEAEKLKTLAVMELSKKNFPEAIAILLEIQDPYFRSQILSQWARERAAENPRKAMEWAMKIPLAPQRHRVMLGLIGQTIEADHRRVSTFFEEAYRTARKIPNAYRKSLFLVELAKDWEGWEKGKAAAVLEEALQSAERIASPEQKAEALERIAAGFQDFDRPRAQRIQEWYDPRAIRVSRIVEEVRILAKAEPERAHRMAQSIPGDFPVQKASALREAAVGSKTAQPSLAQKAMEEALELLLALDDTDRRMKLLSQWVTEAAAIEPAKTFERIRKISEGPLRDGLLKDAGFIWAGKNPDLARKAALEIAEGSTRFLLYQKMAEKAPQWSPSEEMKPLLAFLLPWGEGRQKAKKEETEALPFYERAYEALGRISDGKERANLQSLLAADWAAVDEGKGLRIAETIPESSTEPLSFALLKVGAQLAKWDRKEGERILEKARVATLAIGDPTIRARRLLQLSLEFYGLDAEKGKSTLRSASAEAEKAGAPGKISGNWLKEILSQQVRWGEKIPSSPEGEFLPWIAQALLEGGKHFAQRFKEENLDPLEKAWQFAQSQKNSKLMGEAAAVWMKVSPSKGLDLLNQIESPEIRIDILHRAGREKGEKNRPEAIRYLELASQEALKINSLASQLEALRSIGRTCASLDREKAKEIYRKAYQSAEKVYMAISPRS